MDEPTFFQSFADFVKTGAAAALVWVGGETGRVIVAGGIGGLAGWLGSEKRQIRDGVLRVFGGALAARYLWPAPLHVLAIVTGPLEKSSENIAMAAFLAGAMGMSFVKILTAWIEAQTKAKKGETDA